MTENEYRICCLIVRAKYNSDKLLSNAARLSLSPVRTQTTDDHNTSYGYWLGQYAAAKHIAEMMGIPNLQRELQRISADMGRQASELAQYPIEYKDAQRCGARTYYLV